MTDRKPIAFNYQDYVKALKRIKELEAIIIDLKISLQEAKSESLQETNFESEWEK